MLEISTESLSISSSSRWPGARRLPSRSRTFLYRTLPPFELARRLPTTFSMRTLPPMVCIFPSSSESMTSMPPPIVLRLTSPFVSCNVSPPPMVFPVNLPSRPVKSSPPPAVYNFTSNSLGTRISKCNEVVLILRSSSDATIFSPERVFLISISKRSRYSFGGSRGG